MGSRVIGSCFSTCRYLSSLIIVNVVCGYWFEIERIEEMYERFGCSLEQGLLSEVLFIFASILFSINLIVWSLIDNDLGFGLSYIKWLLLGILDIEFSG